MALPTPAALLSLPTLIDQVRDLAGGDSELLRHAADAAGGLAMNLAMAGATLLGTLWAARWLSALTADGIARAHRHRPTDTTLQSFAASLVRYLVVVVGMIAVLQELGFKATSVIAVLGAASLAIGLALQGALSNVAAGVMILILRPYRVGDAVEIHGQQGTVKGLDLFSTKLANGDNLSVFVPNAKAFGEIIVNQSAPAHRRAQLDFTIDYEDDVDRALALMLACAAAEPRVAAKPAPWAKLTALTSSGVTVSLRVWFTPDEVDDGHYDLMKTVKDRLEAEGFEFPYPHQVAVQARAFTPPRTKRRAPPRAQAAKAPSRRPAAPRPTRAGSSKGR
jgi:small conductance mechanosensitive channel